MARSLTDAYFHPGTGAIRPTLQKLRRTWRAFGPTLGQQHAALLLPPELPQSGTPHSVRQGSISIAQAAARAQIEGWNDLQAIPGYPAVSRRSRPRPRSFPFKADVRWQAVLMQLWAGVALRSGSATFRLKIDNTHHNLPSRIIRHRRVRTALFFYRFSKYGEKHPNRMNLRPSLLKRVWSGFCAAWL